MNFFYTFAANDRINNMDRSQEIIRTSWIGIAANLLLAGFKAAVGILASSVAIVMDAVNNLSDALSSVITIVGTKLSQRPADRKHPFGFGRVEYFSAIIIAVIVLSAGITSLIESGKKIFDPTEPEYTTTTLVVIVVAIVVKLILGQYVKRKGQQLKSDALIASGSDALFDAVITLATLVSAGVMLLWGVSLDGILGALISVVIIKAGIVKIGSLHINVYDTMTAHDIHGLTRQISTRMFEKYGIVMTVGVYAVATGDNRRAELQAIVMQTIARHKDIVQVHGFYYSEKNKYLSVDVVPDISVHDDTLLVSQLANELQPLVPETRVVIVVDHNYTE